MIKDKLWQMLIRSSVCGWIIIIKYMCVWKLNCKYNNVDNNSNDSKHIVGMYTECVYMCVCIYKAYCTGLK